MSEEIIKESLKKEQKRLSDLKYETKKRLEKLRVGGFKRKVKFTEEDLLNIIEDCNMRLDTRGSTGRTKFVFDYPRLENYQNWNKIEA